MASPIAHSLTGATIYLWSIRSNRPGREQVLDLIRHHWRLIAAFAVLANLPDGDFILGWLATGDANQYHHGWTHSIPVTMMAALLSALVVKVRPGFLANWLWSFAAIGSHLVVDYFTGPELGLQPAYGMPLLWPFSQELFPSPISLVVGPQHHEVAHLFSLHNWVWGAYEAAILGGLLLLTLRFKKA